MDLRWSMAKTQSAPFDLRLTSGGAERVELSGRIDHARVCGLDLSCPRQSLRRPLEVSQLPSTMNQIDESWKVVRVQANGVFKRDKRTLPVFCSVGDLEQELTHLCLIG